MTELCLAYLENKSLALINDLDHDDRMEFWRIVKPARDQENQELIRYLKEGYRLAVVASSFSHYESKLSSIFNIYPPLKKTDMISIVSSDSWSKIMGLSRDKIVIVILPSAREMYNLMDHAKWMQRAGYKLIYEVTS